jgi:hypothetical protein
VNACNLGTWRPRVQGAGEKNANFLEKLDEMLAELPRIWGRPAAQQVKYACLVGLLSKSPEPTCQWKERKSQILKPDNFFLVPALGLKSIVFSQNHKMFQEQQLKIKCVCVVFCLGVCLLCVCMPGALGGQKRLPHPPELHLQTFVSHHVGAGNWTQVLWKSSQCF